MLVCTICGKEFEENAKTDYEFFMHMMSKHKEQVKETAKNIEKESKNHSNKKMLQKNKKEGI